MLRFIAVDKIQLFVHYGLSYWPQIAMLSTTTFKQITNGKYTTKVPVLFIIASCTNDMFQPLRVLAGLEFNSDNWNVFWPGSFDLIKRLVYTMVVYAVDHSHIFLSSIEPSIGSNPDHRFVFFANSRTLTEKSADKFGE